MKHEDDFEQGFAFEAMSDELVEQFVRQLQEALATDKVYGAMLVKSMTDGPYLDTEVQDEEAQKALLFASENTSGVLH